MTVDRVRARYPERFEAVEAFFARFYGTEIGETEDEEDDVMILAVGKAKRIVAIHADFLAEFDAGEIPEKLAAWNVAHLSRTLERGCRLKITSEGPEEERD